MAKNKKHPQRNELGKNLIESAIKLDETLAELLKVEVKNIKKNLKNNTSIDNIQRSSNLLKNIIIALTLTEEKIKDGIAIWKEENK